MLFSKLKKWWRPTEYWVEYFSDQFTMCGYHDEKKFDTLDDANARLQELADMDRDEITEQLGFVPASLRVLCGIYPNPIRRFLNACGSKRLYRIGPFWF